MFNHGQRLSDLERRLDRLISYGRIAEADYPNARVRVLFSEGHTSGWLPWLTQRASGTELTWDAPELDERVVVFAPSGTLEAACVLPALYSPQSAPQINTPDISGRGHTDGGYDIYDNESSTRVINLPDAGTLIVQIGTTRFVVEDGQITLSADEVVLEGRNAINLEAPQITLEGDVALGGSGGKPIARNDDAVAGGKVVATSTMVTSK